MLKDTWKSIYPNTYSDLADVHGQIKQMWFQIKDGQTASNITIYPLICSASETEPTAWTPYANECPISGWTGVQGQRTANAQQWDEQYLSGYYNSSGVYVSASGQLCTKNKIPVAPNKE